MQLLLQEKIMNLFLKIIQKGGYEVQSYFESPARVQPYEEMVLVHIQPLIMMLYGRLFMLLLF